MFRWFEHSQVYHPDRNLVGEAAQLGRPFEDVYFSTSDGVVLNGWFFPAKQGSPRSSQVVLLCHGNAGNISYRLDFAQTLLETGLAVFLFDYRGYGLSKGRPGEEGTYLDAQATHQWLKQKGYAESNIIVYGESLGGGVGSELALRENLGGLILQSTFTSIPEIGAELFPWLPVRWINTIKYDTCAKLPKIHIPVLVMHGRNDELIRFHHGEKLFAAANQPKLFWELQGDHNSPMADRALFIEGIERFLRLAPMKDS